MQYAIGLSIGFWAIVIGTLIGFWGSWGVGLILIALGTALIAFALWRAMQGPDPYEDEHAESL